MTTTPPAPTPCCKRRFWLWILAFLAFYIVTVVPVGMALYMLKSEMGWNVLKDGGYHTYLRCMQRALR